MTAKISEKPFDTGTRSFVRRFSVDHLRCENVYAKIMTPDQIADLLELEAPSSATAGDLARRLRNLDRPDECDRMLAMSAVRRGQGLGLAGGWGTPPEAHLLWAGAALLLEARGVTHPNEIPPDSDDDGGDLIP